MKGFDKAQRHYDRMMPEEHDEPEFAICPDCGEVLEYKVENDLQVYFCECGYIEEY